MTLYETFLVGLSAITLLVTIAGWWRTSSDQRKLLDRQIAADEFKARLALRVPRRIDQLDKVKQWVADTDRLRRRSGQGQHEPNREAEFLADFQRWEQAFWTDILPLAPILDSDLENLLRMFFHGENYFMIMRFNGQGPALENRLWNQQANEARKALRAKLTELEETIFET